MDGNKQYEMEMHEGGIDIDAVTLEEMMAELSLRR